jgi:hypothetical protein
LSPVGPGAGGTKSAAFDLVALFPPMATPSQRSIVPLGDVVALGPSCPNNPTTRSSAAVVVTEGAKIRRE